MLSKISVLTRVLQWFIPVSVVHLEVWSTASSTAKSHLLRRAKCIRRPLRVVKWQRRSGATRRSAGEVKLNCFKAPPGPPGQRQRPRQVGEAICNLETSPLGVVLSFGRPPGSPRPRGHSHTQTTSADWRGEREETRHSLAELGTREWRQPTGRNADKRLPTGDPTPAVSLTRSPERGLSIVQQSVGIINNSSTGKTTGPARDLLERLHTGSIWEHLRGPWAVLRVGRIPWKKNWFDLKVKFPKKVSKVKVRNTLLSESTDLI